MLKRVLVLVVAVGAMVSTGCQKAAKEKPGAKSSSSGRVAVVDLNKIAEDIGHKAKIEEAGQIRDRNLRLRLQVEQQNVQVKLAAIAKEIGKRPEPKGAKPTEAEQKLIDEWVGKRQNLERARLEASSKIQRAVNQQRQANTKAFRDEVNKIRNAVKPLAKSIAQAKGLDIVMTASSVLVHADAIDITAEVYEEVNSLIKADSFPTVKPEEPLKVIRQPTTTAPAPAGGPLEPGTGGTAPKQ